MAGLTRMFGFILIVAVVGSTVAHNCDPVLKAAIENFYRGTRFYGNALYGQVNAAFNLDEYTVETLTGYNLNEESDLHEFACGIAKSNSRLEIGEALNISQETVDGAYNQLLKPISEAGGVADVVKMGETMLDLLKWTEETGYPVLPFTIDKEKTLQLFTRVQKAMESDFVAKYIIEVPFPLGMSPDRAVTLLSDVGGSSYEELEKAMEVPPGSLKRWADWQKHYSKAVSDAIVDGQVTVNLLKAADKTGTLYYT